jgi:uncharacterized membrane protein YgcG
VLLLPRRCRCGRRTCCRCPRSAAHHRPDRHARAGRSAALEAKLAAFEAEAGPQIVVLLVPTTAPEDIAAYAQRVADEWKIGRREVGDGVLVVVAKNDRRVRIEVAKALEGAVPDLAARQIIDRAITPAFRAGDYAGGIDAALDQLMARIKGEDLPAPQARPQAEPGLQLEELVMFMFVAVPIVGAVLTGIFGRKLGSLLTGGAAGGLGWCSPPACWPAWRRASWRCCWSACSASAARCGGRRAGAACRTSAAGGRRGLRRRRAVAASAAAVASRRAAAATSAAAAPREAGR